MRCDSSLDVHFSQNHTDFQLRSSYGVWQAPQIHTTLLKHGGRKQSSSIHICISSPVCQENSHSLFTKHCLPAVLQQHPKGQTNGDGSPTLLRAALQMGISPELGAAPALGRHGTAPNRRQL